MKKLGVAVLIAVVSIGWFVTRADGSRPRYRLATATTQTVTESLDEVGTVEPVSAASVGFSVAGKVASVAVERGATVTRGQTLATLDTTEVDAAVDGAQAARDQAKVALADALAANASDDAPEETGRVGGVTGSASAEQLRRLRKDIDAADAAVAVAKEAVAAATIVSPIDGTIEAIGFGVGDLLTAGSAESIRVVGPSGFEVTAIVAVDDLADVKLGQHAIVTPDGSQREIEGQVVAIGAPRSSNGSTTYPVTVGVDDDSALRNGTVAGVAITISESTSSVVVPTSAVQSDGARKTVRVLRDGKPIEVSVTLGAVGRTFTAIESGVRAGDSIVLADLDEPLPTDVTSSTNGESRVGPVMIERGGPSSGGPPVGVRIGG